MRDGDQQLRAQAVRRAVATRRMRSLAPERGRTRQARLRALTLRFARRMRGAKP